MKSDSKKCGAGVVYILLSGEIETDVVASFCKLLTQLPPETQTLYLMMATGGGSVTQGFALYNLLLSLPYKIITYNIANVDSIGNIVFLAGAERYAVPNSIFLIHGVKTEMNKESIGEDVLKERLSALEADNKRIRNVYIEHTQLTEQDLNALFISGVAQNAAYALKKGIIGKISDLSLPSNCILHAIGSQSSEK